MGDGSPSRFDSKGKGRASPQNGDILALDLGSAEEGAGSQNGGAFMQMQLVEQQVRSNLKLVNLSHLLNKPS
jgi:syntaxin 5